MGSAAIVIDNNADAATVGASSQVLTLPVSNLLTPHPSERWRSLTSADFLVLDKGSLISADTVMLCGMTCGANATIRLRLSTIDASGAAGDILDTGLLSSGDVHFDVEYGSFVYRLSEPTSWRYVRFDISDPDATFVEAGCILDGLSTIFDFNFVPGGSIQHVDLSRVAATSSGMTLTWDDSTFRRIDFTFDFVSEDQRYGLVERMDRVIGRKRNVFLMTNPDSTNLPRDSVFGLVTNITPITFGAVIDIFGKQLQIDERI
jgi:hypothetical protein